MKRFALCAVVATTLTVPRPVPAQSCAIESWGTCLREFGDGWVSRVLANYCGLVRIILCDAGF